MDTKKRLVLVAMRLIADRIQEDKDFRHDVREIAGLNQAQENIDLTNEAMELLAEKLFEVAGKLK